ncbi:MAG: 1,6-anhydro-N-acetylmuramyl-L-alanine amidase AmpD [Methylophaga sp.]|nr:MAG: 1,6-anhydro-N-acetylmuramyl-L-alanine amidase AmpD [Methylophaga sp.]
MRIKADGILTEIKYHPSPNQDARPDAKDIAGIIIHNISLPPGEFGGGWIDDLFLNKLDPTAHPYFEQIAELRVSTHLLIRRDGEVIQYVPFYQRAWHAGESQWDERACCNDFTIGIEVEGCDEQVFEPIQYQQLAKTIYTLCEHYPLLSTATIKGHQEIAPDRKTDPGPYFDWDKLKSLLGSE